MVQGNIFPKRPQDRALFMFMVIGIPFALWFEAFIVVPVYYPVFSSVIFIHISCGLFIAVNALANMYFVITTDSSTKVLEDVYCKNQTGWKYCDTCNRLAPPRSYHCPHCKECIVKRDHHCMFTGCCVGYYNHRYFVIAMMYLWLGAVYGNLFTIDFFITQLGGYRWQTFLTMLGPHIAVMFGALTLYTFTISVLFMLAAVVLFATSWLFFWQLYLIYHAQTMYEAKHKLQLHDGGQDASVRQRIIDVLGHRWYLTLVSPTFCSPLSATTTTAAATGPAPGGIYGNGKRKDT